MLFSRSQRLRGALAGVALPSIARAWAVERLSVVDVVVALGEHERAVGVRHRHGPARWTQ